MNQYEIKVNGAEATLIQTNKFKTISVIVSFVGNFTKENCTIRSLLSRVIANTTSTYPTKSELARKAFSLYDANVYASNLISYETSITNFVLDVVHHKYVGDEQLFQDAFQLLNEIIFCPHITNDGFDEAIFQEEKRSLKDALNSIYNHKGRYAYKRLLENMAPDEIISVYPQGTIDELEKITPQSLYQFYLEMLEKEEVKIHIIGDLKPSDVEKYFKDFIFQKNKVQCDMYPRYHVNVQKVRQFKEVQDIKQAKLMMGFRVHITIQDPLYVPLLLFNAMFGGMFGSSLFTVIREEHSLAYDVYSDLSLDKGIMVVSAGIDSNKDEITADLIIKEFEKYRQGEIDEALLQLAKDFLLNDLNEMNDNPYSILLFQLKSSLQSSYSLEKISAQIQKAQKEQIQEVSQHIDLDTIFVLKAGDKDA